MSIENARVVVTGGAGFIGSHLVDRLLAANNHVLVVDDFTSGRRENLAHHEENGRLQIEQADVCEAGLMEELLRPPRSYQGAQYVFHLATRNVRSSLLRPTVVHEVNTTGTLNVLKAAAAAGVRRFLYCSSSEVNGTADVVPMPEEYHYKPETIYGASKLLGEYYTEVFHRSGWLETVIARPHNNYGPREHYAGVCGEVIPRFILWALAGKPLVIFGDGRQTRDFTFVGETAEYLVRLMECDAAVGRTFNICRGEEVSIRELATHIRNLTGPLAPIEYHPGRPSDVLRLLGDPSRLQNILGESPRISIRDGLSQTIEWFQKHVPVNAQTLDSLEPANWTGSQPEAWIAQTQEHMARRARAA